MSLPPLPPVDLPRKPENLVDLIRMRSQLQPDDLMYLFLTDGESEEVRITYAEMDRRARRVAAWLQQNHLFGERALLLFPPGLDFIAAYMGCLYGGVVAVPSYPPRVNRPSPRIQTIVSDSQAVVVLTTGEIYASMEQRFEFTPDLRDLRWLDIATLESGLEERWIFPEVNAQSLAFLQYTSGSTSQPKGVMVSHANLLHNLEMIRLGFRLVPGVTTVIWLPNYHDMGLIGGILGPMYAGGKSILMSPFHFLQRPLRWLQAIHKYSGEISGGPNFAFDMCVEKTTPEQRQALDLSSLSAMFSGAEPIRAETMKRFSEAFAVSGFNPNLYYPCYGLAEGTLFVTGGDGAKNPEIYPFSRSALAQGKVRKVASDSPDAQFFIGSGQTKLEARLAIVNPDTLERCKEDEVGEIWQSGGSVAQGYWRRTEESERIFNAHIAGSQEGPYLRTGDLGFIYDDELFIAGRSKDLIIIRGSNHYPQDIELTVEQSHPALQASGGAAFSLDVKGEEQLVVVHELTRTQRNADQSEIFRAIRKAISENHDLQVYAIVLLRPLSVPKTSSGKIQRHAARAGFINGTLESLGEWRMPG
jgi:acyl-CoA synthetase (AMP-forming)/AMP-acid ligase II